MHAPNLSTSVFPTWARRACGVLVAAGLAVANARCHNDPVEVIETYQNGGGWSVPGGPGRVSGPSMPRDSFVAFSRAATLELRPGQSPTR